MSLNTPKLTVKTTPVTTGKLRRVRSLNTCKSPFPHPKRTLSMKTVNSPAPSHADESSTAATFESLEIQLFRQQEKLLLEKKEKYRSKVKDLEAAIDDARRDFQRLKSDFKIEIATLEREMQQLHKKTSNTLEEVNRVHELRRLKKERMIAKDQCSTTYRQETDMLREKVVRSQQKHLSVCSELETVQQQIAFYMQSRTQGRATCIAPKPPCAVIFTDISSSTRIWRRDATTAMQALEVHNAVIRNLIQEFAHRCQIMELKVEGDSFVIMVDSAVEAVRFALVMQMRLLEARWPAKLSEFPEAKTEFTEDGSVLYRGLRVRVGVNYGDMILKVDPIKRVDYLGSTMNLGARLESNAAIGGLVAISESVWEGLKEHERTHPTDKIDYLMHDVGTMSFKGIPEPHHVRVLFPNASLVYRLSSKEQFMSKTEKEAKKTKEEVEMWKEKFHQKTNELKKTQNRMVLIEKELHSTKSNLYQRLRSKVDKLESTLQTERRDKESLIQTNTNLQMRLRAVEAENHRLMNQRKATIHGQGGSASHWTLYGSATATVPSALHSVDASYNPGTVSNLIVDPASPAPMPGHFVAASLAARKKRERMHEATRNHDSSSSSIGSINTMTSLSPLSPQPGSYGSDSSKCVHKYSIRKSVSPPKKRKKEIDLSRGSPSPTKGTTNQKTFITQQSTNSLHSVTVDSARTRAVHRISMDLSSPVY